MPPIITSGTLAYDLRLARGPGAVRSTEHLVTGALNANSYIYQPWFARVSGSLGLTVARSKLQGEDQGPIAVGGSNDRFTTGGLRLDLFPRSRFPFEMHYDVTDSRIDSGSPGTFDYRARTVGASQKYRPPDGRFNVSGSAERRVFDSAGTTDTLDALLADFTTRWKNNEAALGGSYSRGRRGSTNETSLFRSVVGRHHYSPGNTLSVDTTLNWTNTDDRLQSFSNNVSLLQLSSVGVWQPEGRPWTLTGGLRALSVEDEFTGNSSQSYGATAGATYEVNKNLRLTATGSANILQSRVQGDSATSESVLGSVGATYQGDTIDLRGFRYDWFGGGSVSASNSDSQTEQTLAAQAGHTLSRTWETGEQSTLGVNFGQSLSTTRTRQNTDDEIAGLPLSSTLIVHNAAVSWTTGGADRNGLARASYSDSAEIGGGSARFQLLNLQVSGTLQIDRNQSLTGDLTTQWTRQSTGDLFDSGLGVIVPSQPSSNISRGGELSYRHSRLFDVPRLRFTSRLSLAQNTQDQPGALALIPDRETRLWENRLDWDIGRLQTQLVLRFSWVDGDRRSQLLWRVQRSFGQ